MKLTRQYFNIKDVSWGDTTSLSEGILTLCKKDLKEQVRALFKAVEDIEFEIVKPKENTRIIHLLDTIQPMYKLNGNGMQYSGFFGSPVTVGDGTTNILNGLTIMESAALPWENSSASSGLLYPRDAIMDMTGPIAGFTPFCDTLNLVILYKLAKNKSSIEYDNDIRLIAIKISTYLASLTKEMKSDETVIYTIDKVNPELPNVVLVWQCQNQGPYANTFLYGESIDNLVPTLLDPNELLDGCVVSGNYVWPAFKVPTYLHTNHPIVMELYKNHGKTLNFRGVIFCRSHNPTNWHKERCANFNVKLAKYLDANGIIMAWEGGGNAAVDGMLTIQCAERNMIKASTITFEFGGVDGTEGILLVDDVPEANAIISGGSIEKHYILPEVERVVGGDFIRLNKEAGGYFPISNKAIEFENTTHFYLSGNQSGHSRLFAEAY
ncbi:glycine/sarcosine/betaine reductase component B subunit [Clostridium omnivorum]|uniref:Glycine reductase complex proprotein GrdE1 n=1 Tax=Clostridium omnivorum TaxID=1604902 RepID=A0ABQ5NCD3_9CLOT|nr:glycine/sarcosine/betaine reductase component B subunit [Clostridium sp. E14]GLC32855.1 glycine reductase complex proprotein GrdE1 [Clostridium sp. E14]